MRAFVGFSHEALRKILDRLGNKDISSIGDGTVTGGLKHINDNVLYVESFDKETGTLITRTADYTG